MIATLADPRDVQLFDKLASRLGREDGPIGFAAGDANLYRYVGNSPVNGSDPRGLVGGGRFIMPGEPTPSPRPTPPNLPPPGTVPGPGWTPGPGWQWTPHPNAPGGGVWDGPGGQSLHPDCPHGDKPGHYDWNDPWGNGWEGYPVPDGPPQWKPKPGNNPNKPQPLFPPGTAEACAVAAGAGIGAWFVYYVLPWLMVGGAPVGI